LTRSQAIKKLQITLKDFRRLCILKGIYPREPRNKKAFTGNKTNKTYYLAKDVSFLTHEPVLKKFRELKTFMRKLTKAKAKKEYSLVKQLVHHKPVYTLDHLIKERYPTFMNAIQDLDDALCLIFLFSHVPKSNRIPGDVIEDCHRLSKEFMNYIVQSHSLRKVFLSIKGIYYQATIMGQVVTWIMPYIFSQHVNKRDYIVYFIYSVLIILFLFFS
jgi:pescadillo protein